MQINLGILLFVGIPIVMLAGVGILHLLTLGGFVGALVVG